MQSLAATKEKFEDKVKLLTPVTELNRTSISHRPQKLNKKKKPKKKSDDWDEDNDGEVKRKLTNLSETPQINIFEVNTYQAEGYDPD